jgi:hypothetical protein
MGTVCSKHPVAPFGLGGISYQAGKDRWKVELDISFYLEKDTISLIYLV